MAGAVTTWNTTVIDGKKYLVIDVAKLRIPLEWDPSSNVFIAVSAPGGAILNYPALLAGEDGQPPDIDNAINLVLLEAEDPTPDSANWTETAPNVYKLTLTIHRPADGLNGSLTLDPDDFGTPVPGRQLIVNPAGDGFLLAAPKVGDWFTPGSLAAVPTGNPAYTIVPVAIPAQLFDWRPHVQGQVVCTGTGSDVRADAVARLSTTGTINGETAGPEVGRGFGPIGVNAAGIAAVLSACTPPGSAPTYDRVLAGNSAVIYFRTERQAGGNTYSTSPDTTRFRVKVDPIP